MDNENFGDLLKSIEQARGIHNNQLQWDIYFLRIAKEVSKNSKCLSRQIGAVLVKDKSVISTGYNGAPRGIKHCNERNGSFYKSLVNSDQPEYCSCGSGNISSGSTCIRCQKIIDRPLMKDGKIVCPRKYFNYKSGEGLFLCSAGHSERNALIQAARNGISTLNTTLYCYCGQICKDCSIELINAGVKELVYLDGQPDYDNYSRVILKEGNIEVRKIKEELL